MAHGRHASRPGLTPRGEERSQHSNGAAAGNNGAERRVGAPLRKPSCTTASSHRIHATRRAGCGPSRPTPLTDTPKWRLTQARHLRRRVPARYAGCTRQNPAATRIARTVDDNTTTKPGRGAATAAPSVESLHPRAPGCSRRRRRQRCGTGVRTSRAPEAHAVPRSPINGESSHLASTTHARSAGAQAHPHQPHQQMCVADESAQSAVAKVPQRALGHAQGTTSSSRR